MSLVDIFCHFGPLIPWAALLELTISNILIICKPLILKCITSEFPSPFLLLEWRLTCTYDSR